ncbi:hypothetical protein CI102_13884 [Trichoderma harzianum]|nr:hypothetical protein CI102_13884 [Trichoderma harzianum]
MDASWLADPLEAAKRGWVNGMTSTGSKMPGVPHARVQWARYKLEPILRDPPLTLPRQHGAIRDEPTCIQFPSPGSISQSPSRSLSYSIPHEATTQSRYDGTAMEHARLPDGNLSTILHVCCPTICPLASLVAQACGSAIGYHRAPEALSRAIHGSEAVTSHCEKTMIPALHLADSKRLTCDSGLRGSRRTVFNSCWSPIESKRPTQPAIRASGL